MEVSLDTLATCFQGLLPAQLFTCSADGMPNAAYLSHVEYVDPSHVALSHQFFNKSRRNILENPHALVIVPDPDTGQGWSLRLQYVRSETAGPLFDRMALRIEAIASYCGLKDVFRLRAADVYRVLQVEPVPEETGTRPAESPAAALALASPIFTINALQTLSDRLNEADTLESLVDLILRALDESFGFKHSMILVPSEEKDVLVTIATRGYPENGAGAEVRFGEGICGLVAEARKPIRIAGLMRGMLYALAMHREAAGRGPVRPSIPLPRLESPQSQLGIPLLVRGELVGVLCIESDVAYRFHEEDRASIELLGSYVAMAIQNMLLQERLADPPPPIEGDRKEPPRQQGPALPLARLEVVYYQADECVMVNGEYLIRSIPAKILWRLLTTYASCGRRDFTNRELRLDKSLNLPEWKDNLESRLLLLRRRLEQKCPQVSLVPAGRGRFVLDVRAALALSEK